MKGLYGVNIARETLLVAGSGCEALGEVTGTIQGVEWLLVRIMELICRKDGVTGMILEEGEGSEVRSGPTGMILVGQLDWTVSSVLNSGCSL